MNNQTEKYVSDFIHSILGSPAKFYPKEIIENIFNSLVLGDENNINRIDQFGNWSPKQISEQLCNKHSSPWIDNLLMNHFRDDFMSHIENRWPDNKSFALCLTHDVDFVTRLGNFDKLCRRFKRIFTADGPSYFPAYQALGSVYRVISSLGKLDLLGHYEDWMKLEESYGFKSTFYFFSYPSRSESVYDCDYKLNDKVSFDGKCMTVAEMISSIDRAGWEIGLHGSINSCTDKTLLLEQKKSLEYIINKEVRSVRNHYLCFDSQETHQIQANVGFKTDSTIGFNSYTGFRAGTSFPYWCWDIKQDKKLTILEIPLILMDVSLFNKNCFKNVDDAVSRCIDLMNEVERVGGCLTLNWHPNYLNDETYFKTYEILLQEAKSRNAWGCSAGQLYDWWVK